MLSSQKALLCNPCLRNELSPFSQEGQRVLTLFQDGTSASVTKVSPLLLAVADCRLMGTMPRDPFIREKFTRERTAARKHAKEYFQRFPKARYRTEIESWRELQSQNI